MTGENENPSFGITTGSAATAASLASLIYILNKNDFLEKAKEIDYIHIKVPFGDLNIEIEKIEAISNFEAKSYVIKNEYGDLDATMNLEIAASVKLVKSNEFKNNNGYLSNYSPRVRIFGGIGVGKVTKPGLQVPQGFPAINPVPQKTITENILKYLPDDCSVEVTISIPKGVEVAKKTMNPRLGIINGLSILGTTGIARPMSSKAYQDSLVCQIDVALAQGFKKPIFVPGNIGEKIAKDKFNAKEDEIVQMSNFVGFMLEEAEKRGIKEITLLGHIGKLIKLAGGIFNTKHSVADGRREIMITHAAINGAKVETLIELFNSPTTEDMMDTLRKENIDKSVFDSISSAIKERCENRVDIKFNVILLDMKGNVLSRC